jgi:O-antigen/teichoic acid export membrane protein
MGARTRTILGLTDQGIYTLSNLLLIMAAAHFGSPSNFGAFGIAYSSYIFASGLVEALCTEALLLRASKSEELLRRAGCAALGAALALALVLGPVMIVIGFLSTDPLSTALLLTGLLLPGLITQDSLRRYFFATARPTAALMNDTLWLGIQVIALLTFMRAGHDDVEYIILAWAGAGNLAAVVGLLQAYVVPRITDARVWWRENRVVARSYVLEFLTLAGAAQALVYVVAATSGLEAAAAFRVGLTIFGPLNIAVTAARVVGLPELVRLRAFEYDKYRVAILVVSLACGGLAVASGVAALALPHRIGVLAFGASWALALPLVLPLSVQRMSLGLSIGPILGMRCSGAASVSMRIRTASAVVELAIGTAAALQYGVVGAAYGIGLANVLGLLAMGRQYVASERTVLRAAADLDQGMVRRTTT